MTVAIYIGSIALGILSLLLFVVAIRRIVGEHSETVAAMMERYDERLASFTQTLSDALAASRADALASGAGGEAEDDHGTIMRTLEVARAKTAADAAIAMVTGALGTPTVASVGLSQEEAAEVARMGLPDYRGARALEISFSGAAGQATPIRSGLAVALVPSPSMLAVLTRSADRRFSEEDVAVLEAVAGEARPAIERSLGLREADPVPELDLLTSLYDRQSFHAIADRELARARLARHSLSLLVADVDRLTTINARFGHLAGDTVLEEIASRLRDVTGAHGFPCRLEGGRFAVLMADADGRAAEDVFERLRASLAERPIGEAGTVSVSAGIAELLPLDTPASMLERAETALRMAKGAGTGTIVSTALR